MAKTLVEVANNVPVNFSSVSSLKIWIICAVQDPAGIQTQDLLNTNQALLPLSHLDPWYRGAGDKLHKQHCLEASAEFQLILTLSRLD